MSFWDFITIVMISAHIDARLGKGAAENGVSGREIAKTG
jgi:hypothetical protein